MTEEQISQDNNEQDQVQAENGTRAPEPRVEDLLRFSMNLFAEQAWMSLGIRALPGSGETKMDIGQARLAIDAFGALAQLTEHRFDPHEVRDLKNMLASLQLNFAQRAAGV